MPSRHSRRGDASLRPGASRRSCAAGSNAVYTRILEPRNLLHLSQVSCSQFSLLDPGVDLLFQLVEAAQDWARNGRSGRHQHAQSATEDPGVGSSAEQSDAKSEAGEPITVGFGNALD